MHVFAQAAPARAFYLGALAPLWRGSLGWGIVFAFSGVVRAQPVEEMQKEKGTARVPPEVIEVVVDTGTRRAGVPEDSPVRTQSIDREALENSAAPTVSGVLLGISGIELDADPHGGAPTLHGLEPEHLLILRDGQRVTGRAAGRVDLGRFYSLRYASVEWVAGRASSLYGSDAIAGVLNLKTRWPKQGWEPNLRLSLGNYRFVSGFAGIGWAKGKWSAMLSAGGMRRDAFDLTPATPSTSGDAMRQGDIEAGLRWKGSRYWEISLLGGYGDQTYQGIDQSGAGAVLVRTNRTFTPRADLKATRRFGRGQSSVTLHYDAVLNRLKFDQRGDTALDRVNRTHDHVSSLELVHQHELATRHWVSVGLQGQIEQMKGERIGSQLRLRPRIGLFIQDEWSLGSGRNWSLVPSARVDGDRYFGWSVTPQLAAMWRYKERLQVRASVGRGYRAPSFKDLFLVWNNPSAGYRVRGNPDLRPESSWGANASVDLRLTQTLDGNLQLFEQRLSGLIAPIPGREVNFDGLTFRYQNIGKATTRGAESGLAWRYDGAQVQAQLNGGYRFLYTRNHEAKRSLAGRAPHRVRLRGTLWVKSWGLRIAAHSSLSLGQAYFVAPSGGADGPAQKKVLAPQWRLRMTFRQRVYRNLAVFGRGENLLGAGDPEFAPLARRALFIGLSWLHENGDE